jgi:hypothetical protein
MRGALGGKTTSQKATDIKTTNNTRETVDFVNPISS